MKKHQRADPLYQSLLNRLDQVTVVPSQNLGFLTPVYKFSTGILKQNPWKILLPLSLVIALIFLRLAGILSIKTVSVLQSSF